MTWIILAAFAALACASPALAQNWSSNRIGPYTYYNGTDSNGGSWSGSSNSIGNYTYHRFNGPQGQSQSCTSNTIGQYTYTNC